MTVNIGTELVNSGNSGWTNLDVMNALEKVFYDMGWNSGTQKDGVPIALIYPGGYTTGSSVTGDVYNSMINTHTDATPTINVSSFWGRCGGAPLATVNVKYRYFYVTNTGTTSYQVAEWIEPSNFGVNNNVITSSHRIGENLGTGTKLTYNGGLGGNGGATQVISGLTANNVYYMRRITDNTFSLHPTANDATNNTNIVTCSSSSLTNPVRFQTDAQTNPNITVGRGDRMYFYTYDMTQGNFRICDFSTGSSYAADRTFHSTANLANATQQAVVSGTGTYSDPFIWNTSYVNQTENEVLDPTQISGTGFTGITAYGYANDTHSNLKADIVISPQLAGTSSYANTYWKYTVTGASGDAANTGTGRTDLKLRIYRDDYSTYYGEISGILICNEATGWSDNDIFTIPGTAIGGASPANDIVFGANNYVSGTNNTPNMLTTNLGAGANMFQKSNDGRYGVLRLENDSSKKFGVTYWGFALSPDNNKITIGSGCGWSYLNRLGKHFLYDASFEGAFGAFNGDMGLDYQNTANILQSSTSSNYRNYHQITTSSGPTNYALKIRYYKAQAPQDTNFAVIQFISTINSVDLNWFTFTLHKGASFGANVWDLDKVWNGTYTEYETQYSSSGTKGREISTYYTTPGFQYGTTSPTHEPPTQVSLAREASYGYCRTTSNNRQIQTSYPSNINNAGTSNDNEVHIYYRNSTYDKVQDNNITDFTMVADQIASVDVNYYKPIKGIPICNQLSPCPYYMPDDFVLIQAEVNPGATTFAVGDIVTIGSSETYTVITADNETFQTGLDNDTGNSANGMLFCARN